MKTTCTTLIATFVLRVCLSASGTLHYVDLNSTNAVPPFTNWATAALTIQDAVDVASAGETVLVRDGVYATGGRTAPANTLTNRVVLDKPVTLQSLNGPAVTVIQGAGPIGTNAIRCVYLTSGTVLSGFKLTLGATGTSNNFVNWNSAGGGAWCASPNAVVTNCVVSCNVAYGEGGGGYGGTWNNCTFNSNSAAGGGAVSSATLRYCTLTRNLAAYGGGGTSQSRLNNCSLVSNSANDGGGNWASWLTNCTLTGNWAKNGGASGAGTLVGCVISNNCAETGGGTYFGTLINCSLISNSAHWGGGMYESTLTNCALIGNVATYSTNYNNGATGGGAYRGTLIHCSLLGNMATNEFGILNRYSYGGGASWSVLNNCTLKSNVAVYGGGAYSATLTNCVLSANSAGSGGAVLAGTLYNCLLSSNSATAFGGGASESTLNHCTIFRNVAVYDQETHYGTGGGIQGGVAHNCIIEQNSAYNGGGAYLAALSGCTLDSNSAVFGGGGYGGTMTSCILTGNYATNRGGGFYGGFTGTLTNCVLRRNGAGRGGGAYFCSLYNCTVVGNWGIIGAGGVDDATLNNSIVYFNSENDYTSINANHSCTTPLPAGGVANFTNAPMFVDLVGGNLRLQSNSPCVNAGNNSYALTGTDLDGRPRIIGGAVDVGAYEFQGPGMSEFIGWLQQHGQPTSGAADYADADSDGSNNRQEWFAGTNPTNVLSVLRMLTPSSATFVGFVSWQSVTNRNYFVQRTPKLHVQSAFITLQSNIVGQTSVTSFTDTSATNGGSYFYRVGIEAW